jgi:hypothetical protein
MGSEGSIELMAKWIFRTGAGLAEIIPQQGGSFALVFDNEALKHHASPAAAAEALANGTGHWHFNLLPPADAAS